MLQNTQEKTISIPLHISLACHTKTKEEKMLNTAINIDTNQKLGWVQKVIEHCAQSHIGTDKES
jgi:hypothetical protein